jgi:hypothetical protein
MRPRSIASAWDPYNVDVRLVAAVQRNCGARCHEAANLLGCYSLCAEMHQRAVRGHDPKNARAARDLLENSEASLRKFLFECRWPDRLRNARGGTCAGETVAPRYASPCHASCA